jgi:hypothetical protein
MFGILHSGQEMRLLESSDSDNHWLSCFPNQQQTDRCNAEKAQAECLNVILLK